MKVAVFSNDIIPGMGLPVAAPGLRAWGLAIGLEANGHETTVLLDDRIIPRAWHRAFPPPMPVGTYALHPRDLEKYLSTHGFDALVITNSNPIAWLTDELSCLLIYDFFAPKMLELEQHVAGLPKDQAQQRLTELASRKVNGLQRCGGVIVNGAKKMPYVREWLDRAGVPATPATVVNMALPPTPMRDETTWPLDIVVSGYIQPWSQPGPWIEAVLPALDAGRLNIHLLMGNHWGGGEQFDIPEVFSVLREHQNVTEHGTLEFSRFRSLLRTCDISVDIFARNPERELAMVTRSVVALSCGVPVIHVPFTEVSSMIEQWHAGWLVDEDDPSAVAQILESIVSDEDELLSRKNGATAMAQEEIEPAHTVRPLVDMLEELA